MEDFIDDDQDRLGEMYEPTPLINALTAALYVFVICLALYGGATLLGVVK